MSSKIPLYELRSCGDCDLCCKHLPVKEYDSPAGEYCKHCDSGCTIHETRAQVCRDFECLWKLQPQIPEEYRPDRIGIFFEMPALTDVYIGHIERKTPQGWTMIQKILETNSLVVDKKIYLKEGDSPERVMRMLSESYEAHVKAGY